MADDADTQLEVENHSDGLDFDESPHEGGTDHNRRNRWVLALAAAAAVVLTAVSTWLGWQLYQSREQQQQREIYLQAARQAALNLTTIDYREADADIRRVLDSTTGAFREDFQKRSQPFIDTVKQAQSTSVGSITAAGLESVSDHEAQALVAVLVKTSFNGAEQAQPRSWRMRLDVEHVGNEVKVSNVEFVA